MFTSIFENTGGLTLTGALICTGASVLLGLVIAAVYMFHNRTNRSYCIALVLLPVIVQAVIMMVNGQIGTGVAVMGAFSLIRFRSAPGKAIDICCIFCAMAIGIATGMGYVYFAAFITAVISVLLLLLTGLNFGAKSAPLELRVTMPETLDYSEAFNECFRKYTLSSELVRVKAGGSDGRYEVRYSVILKRGAGQKEFIDSLRTVNEGLTVILSRDDSRLGELL